MDNNQIEEELRGIKQIVQLILVLVFFILILVIASEKDNLNKIKIPFLSNDASRQTNNKVSSLPKITYLSDEQAIDLYKKHSLERARYNREYGREEIQADLLKTRYLSHKKSLDGYVEYLTKPNERIFVVSESGAWSYWYEASTIDIAIERARTNCEQWLRDNEKQCYIIDINGVFLGDYQK